MTTTDHPRIAPIVGAGPDGPIVESRSKELAESQHRMEAVLATGGVPEARVMDQVSHAGFNQLINNRPVFTLAWPPSWYIPIGADFKDYWVVPPPAENRYDFGWAQSQLYPAPNALRGDANTGQVFAYTALNPSDSHDTAFAGVGVLFRPAASLAYADVSIDADIVAQSRIWMLLGQRTSSGPSVHVRATVYACVWEIDPVTGAWSLVRPFGSHILVDRYDSGLSGTAIQTVDAHYGASALATRVQVQAGRAYAIGFQAQVEIDLEVKGLNGRPYQRSEVDDWKLWASLTCSVPRITVNTQILVP